MRLNLRVRFRNVWTWIRIVIAGAIPVLTGFGFVASEFDTWGKVSDAIMQVLSNPYMLVSLIVAVIISIANVLPDSLTSGLSDPADIMNREYPRTDESVILSEQKVEFYTEEDAQDDSDIPQDEKDIKIMESEKSQK